MDLNQIAQQIQSAIVTRNWQLAAALGLVGIVYLIRRYAPKIHGNLGAFLNSDRGGSLLVMASGVAMSVVTALKTGVPLSLGVVASGITTAVLASGVRNVAWDVLRPADGGAPPAKPLVPPAAVLLLLCLVGVSSCATPGAIAIKNCEVNHLPQTEQGVMACVASAATSGGDAQAAITSCAIGIVPAQFDCLVQGLVAWFKGRVPAHGQADATTLVEVKNLEDWLKAHGKQSCGEDDVNHALRLIDPRMAYASVGQ